MVLLRKKRLVDDYLLRQSKQSSELSFFKAWWLQRWALTVWSPTNLGEGGIKEGFGAHC